MKILSSFLGCSHPYQLYRYYSTRLMVASQPDDLGSILGLTDGTKGEQTPKLSSDLHTARSVHTQIIHCSY